mgnify:CR=1 FL=1
MLHDKNLLPFAIQTAREAGSILMNHFGNIKSINRKSSKIDLVTIADKNSEEYIINQINIHYPDHNIIAEESLPKIKGSDYEWVIDPLDGTTNFVHNLPIFAVSIGLQYKKKTIVGVVYNPAVDKCFWAEENGGAFLNEERIFTSSCSTLNNSLLVTGFPYSYESDTIIFDLFKEFYKLSQGVRRLGAAALDLCFVAMGRFEGFWESGLQPWDICAGSLILKEAKGKVSDWCGSPMPYLGKHILATNGSIHNEMLEIIKKF